MGATASAISPEIFKLAKEEYELRKNDGLSDEQLFNHMKDFIEAKSNNSHEAVAHVEAAPAEAHADEQHQHDGNETHAEPVDAAVAVAVPVAEAEAEKHHDAQVEQAQEAVAE